MLTKQSPPAAAQRGTNGKFSPPGCCARYQKIGDIQACNQKNASRCGQQHVQRRLDVSNHILQKGARLRGFADERIVEVLVVKPPDDERNLRPRLRFGDSRFEPSDWHKVMAIQNFHVLGRFFVVNRYPQLHALFWIGKPGWHNANNCVGLRVHTYRLVQDRRVAAEASLPQSPAQDSCRICGWLIIRRSEASSERGFDPECWQQIRGKLDGAYSFGKLSARSRQVVFSRSRNDRHVRKTMALPLPLGEYAGGNLVVRKFIVGAVLIQP